MCWCVFREWMCVAAETLHVGMAPVLGAGAVPCLMFAHLIPLYSLPACLHHSRFQEGLWKRRGGESHLHLSAMLQQHGDRAAVLVARGEHQRGLALRVSRLDVRPVLQQHRNRVSDGTKGDEMGVANLPGVSSGQHLCMRGFACPAYRPHLVERSRSSP